MASPPPFQSEDQIRDECERWMRGLRFPVDDVHEELVGRAAVQDFDRWWSVIRDLARQAETDEQVGNLGWVLASALVERTELSEHMLDEALGDWRLTCILAEAMGLAGLSSPDSTYAGERRNISRLFGRKQGRADVSRLPTDRVRARFVVRALIAEDPDEAWQVLLALVAEAPDEEVLGFIGAGLLEDFLSAHTSAYINAIEATAAVNPRSARRLACCWIWNDVPDATFERLAQAAGADGPEPTRPGQAARVRHAVEPDNTSIYRRVQVEAPSC